MKKFILLVLTVFMLVPLTSCSNLKKIRLMDIYVKKVLLPLHNKEIKDDELYNQLKDTPLYEDGDISVYVDEPIILTLSDNFEEYGIERVLCSLSVYDGNNAIGSIHMGEEVYFSRPDGSRVQQFEPETREDIITAEIDVSVEDIQDINQEFLLSKGYTLIPENYVTEYHISREYLHDTDITDKEKLFKRLEEDYMIPGQSYGIGLSYYDKISVYRLKEGLSPELLDGSLPLYNFVYFYKSHEGEKYPFDESYMTTNVFYDSDGKLHNQDRVYFANNDVYLDDSGVIDLRMKGFDGFDSYDEEVLSQK